MGQAIKVFVESHHIESPLASGSEENFDRLLNGASAVVRHQLPLLDEQPLFASLFGPEHQFDLMVNPGTEGFTRFEKLVLASVLGALKKSKVGPADPKTVFVFSTTKGNISLLEENPENPGLMERLNLFNTFSKITSYLGNPNPPLVVSNACISGVMAIITAKRLLQSRQFENAVVTGADLISSFVYSGFKSFQALSQGVCKPFSMERDGINLGEGAGTVILTTNKELLNGRETTEVLSGAVTNDANHISGPSRTGEELAMAIEQALKGGGIRAGDIDFISAHGTGTSFNDEMEAKAFAHAGLSVKPLNSLKAYFGHTLGAAGIIETIVSLLSLEHGKIIPSGGYASPMENAGINVCSEIVQTGLSYCLKTSSGFGGCNGVLILKKN